MRLFIKRFAQFFSIATILLPLCADGQVYVVNIHGIDAADSTITKQLKGRNKFDNQMDAYQYVQNIVPALQSAGFLAASADSLDVSTASYEVFVYLGQKYKWALVDFDGVPETIQISAVVNVKKLTGQTLQPRQIAGVSEKLLQWCEQNGYPFASVSIAGMRVDSLGNVSGKFILDRGALKKIDSIEIDGEVHITKNYLLHYLDIRETEPYNEKKLNSITSRLRELPFLQEAQPWFVRFKLSKTILVLHLKEKKANQLNGIIGLIPNSLETNKFLLTVDAQLALQNTLGFGESINVSYQNLQYKSPRLKADVIWPYLLNTRIGAEGHFDLFKKDTSFRRTSLQLGLRYQISATDYIRAFYLNQSNRLITIDTNYIKAQRQLPDNADVSSNGAGGELVLDRTDYRLSPRKGWSVKFSVSGLQRTVRRSDAVTQLNDGTGFDFAKLYDSLDQKRYQYIFAGDAAYYVPMGKRATLKIAYDGGWISGQRLFRNELFQIGGFKLLRGFDEQSIYASQYHIGILEARLLLDQNSYVYLFSDNGWVESNFNGFSSQQVYNGFGIGTTLQTKTGLFSISYALGRSNATAVQLRQSKIHFGYVAYF